MLADCARKMIFQRTSSRQLEPHALLDRKWTFSLIEQVIIIDFFFAHLLRAYVRELMVFFSHLR